MKRSLSHDLYESEYFLQALKEKQASAVSQFYDHFAPAFYGYVKNSLYKTEISEELLEQIFKNILSSIDEFNPEKESLFGFANRIARKEVRLQKVELMVKELFVC